MKKINKKKYTCSVSIIFITLSFEWRKKKLFFNLMNKIKFEVLAFFEKSKTSFKKKDIKPNGRLLLTGNCKKIHHLLSGKKTKQFKNNKKEGFKKK